MPSELQLTQYEQNMQTFSEAVTALNPPVIRFGVIAVFHNAAMKGYCHCPFFPDPEISKG